MNAGGNLIVCLHFFCYFLDYANRAFSCFGIKTVCTPQTKIYLFFRGVSFMKNLSLCLLVLLFSLAPLLTVEAKTGSREYYEKQGQVIWDFPTDQKVVAITFDDGPHPLLTPQILEILAKYDAKATFFVAGNKVERFPEVLARVAKEGHEIGNHTYSHIYSGQITEEKLTEELRKTDELIRKYTGKETTLYRPVGGLYNDRIIRTAVKNGKLAVLWSWRQDPKDWRNPPAARMVNTIKKGLAPGNIILFHDWIGDDSTATSQTVIAFGQLMEYLHENGYECVTVSELMYRANYSVPEYVEPFK